MDARASGEKKHQWRGASSLFPYVQVLLSLCILCYGWLGLFWRSVRFGFESLDTFLQLVFVLLLGMGACLVYAPVIRRPMLRVLSIFVLFAWLLLPEVYYGVQDLQFYHLTKSGPAIGISEARWWPFTEVDLVYDPEHGQIDVVD